jgi:hypothetical protein
MSDRREAIKEALEAQQSNEQDDPIAEAQVADKVEPSASEAPAKEVKTEKVVAEKARKTDLAQTDVSIVDAPVIEKIASPKSLKKELADKYWDKLDPEFQKAIVQREEDSAKGFETYKTHADFGKNVESAIMPYMATINQFGAQPHEAIKELFGVDHVLRYGQPHEKIGMMQRIFRDYGINPQQVFDAYGQQPQIDPSLAPVYNELAQLKQKFATTEQQQQAWENEALKAEIERTKEGKPHFDIVRNDMANLIEAGLATTLDDAYDKAVKLKPELFNALLQTEREKAMASASSTELARKQQAANVSVRGSSPASGGTNSQLSRRDFIASQLS